jgi:ribokinase
MPESIVVIGSTNTDMVIKTRKIPAPGETILGGEFFMNPGGKGANQAVAAARLGGKVTFIAKTGNDIFGDQAKENFRHEGINTSYLIQDKTHPSGVALITVDEKGENSIVVAPGANGQLCEADLLPALPIIEQGGFILMQLEIPMTTVEYVAAIASKNRVKVIINPAPAQRLSDSLLKHISILTPNQSEAALLTGIAVVDLPSAEAAGRVLQSKGVGIIIITLGDQGAFVLTSTESFHIPVQKVEVMDTTAAGDVFNGALTVALAEGKRLREAVEFACRASSISVTRMGAQASAPYRNELI